MKNEVDESPRAEQPQPQTGLSLGPVRLGAEMGRAAMDAAFKRIEAERSDRFLTAIQSLMKSAEHLDNQIARLSRARTKITRRLDAIENGKITLTSDGRFTYDDADLNEMSIDEMNAK